MLRIGCNWFYVQKVVFGQNSPVNWCSIFWTHSQFIWTHSIFWTHSQFSGHTLHFLENVILKQKIVLLCFFLQFYPICSAVLFRLRCFRICGTPTFRGSTVFIKSHVRYLLGLLTHLRACIVTPGVWLFTYLCCQTLWDKT